ncbi:WD40-repeat-containing domain protein [Syncephalastrum racemosum]|uniref:WD40-repeat-containing domain protein n=1 Tax=Syncephalastrum racemosum TaxID=13706 RepID=A0A1X2HSC1_SYNRA|nr:WD40-repeat-containing domain protein [Syncephalastrum racemosum]
MVPAPQSRIVEMLEAIRVEFDQVARDVYMNKTQKDDIEHKMNSQLQEMHNFQATLLELERKQQAMKKQYEEEIARLQHQLEQANAMAGHAPPPPHPSQQQQPPTTPQQQPSHPHTPQPPPSIGPSASNYFGYGYPPPRNPSVGGAMEGGLPPPLSQKRKSGNGTPLMPPNMSPTTAAPGALADIDPDSVPPNMKVEGQDWFALFNPKVPRYLKVDLVHTLTHSSVVCCVKFSANGRYMAAGCNRETFVYDVVTAQPVCVLQDTKVQREGDLYIRSVCFSPDGKYLATGAEDKQIRIWDIASRRIRHIFPGHEQDIYSLDFSRDGRIIVSGSGDCTVRIWSMIEGNCMHVIPIKDLDQKDPGVTSVAVSPDGRLVAAGSLDKMVRVWDIHSAKQLERLEGHKDSVYSVAFMPDGKSLISGSLDKTIKLWELGTQDRSRSPCKTTFTGHKDFVLSVACSPDGQWIVSGSKDRGVQFWDPRTGQTQFMLQGHKNSVISVAVNPSGKPLFATGSGDYRARIWAYEPLSKFK